VSARPVAVARRRISRPQLEIAQLRDYGIVVVLVVLFVVLSFASDVFLTQRNLLNILEQWAPVGAMAVGLTVVVLVAGFDLSIGAIFALAGVVAVSVAQTDPVLGMAAGLGAGLVLGLINGALATFGRMNDFVATLGTSIVFGGAAVAATGGTIQTVDDNGFGSLSNDFLGMSLSIWIVAIFAFVCSLLLTRTTFGRHIYAVGGNEEAARLAGVRVHRVRAAAYTIAGISAGVAAVLIASRSLSANANNGTTTAFSVWTAVLLGGNSMVGGRGSVWRSIVGVLLLALIGNGFNLLGIDPLYQQVVTGGILLIAVGVDAWVRKRGD